MTYVIPLWVIVAVLAFGAGAFFVWIWKCTATDFIGALQDFAGFAALILLSAVGVWFVMSIVYHLGGYR